MSGSITFVTSSERLPILVASGLFVLPGVAAVVVGVLTWFGLSWIANPANGVMLGVTGLIWAGVGYGIFRFRRWITVDADRGEVVQGTRTFFQHPAERHPLAAFTHVVLQDQPLADQRFYVVALRWAPDRRPPRFTDDDVFWLSTHAERDPARADAERLRDLTGLALVDRTRGESP